MDISDFKIIRSLGHGSYSDVYLAKFQDEAFPSLAPADGAPQLFALKIVDKHLAVKHDIVDQVFLERRLHEELNEEVCVARLWFTFKDDDNLYFGLEPCLHGELYDAIEGVLELSEVVFYAAEVVLMLDALRRHGVVHLDLKPENILLGTNGHLKLVDLGSALWLCNDEPQAKRGLGKKRAALVGTADYVAPEALSQRDGSTLGYGVDLWAFGVVLYQMLVGEPPFRGLSEYLTFQNVLKNDPDLSRIAWEGRGRGAGKPVDGDDRDKHREHREHEEHNECDHQQDQKDRGGGGDRVAEGDVEESRDYALARDLVSRLLQSDPDNRIGMASIDELRGHALFENVDWDSLYDQTRPTPYYVRRNLGAGKGGAVAVSDEVDEVDEVDEDWELKSLRAMGAF